ncbi:hypothetical protein QQ020_16615 [Fulvivirgaceae bacterium BMA12]|uniref:Uncharacterized protein n=1 Tax=Agaribacillus aureus TaxID=3051825 RepID=A0ABT8L7G1_9BACT|nr:hypothetical protein [Fulvivirgaceae bacterium BMA12]
MKMIEPATDQYLTVTTWIIEKLLNHNNKIALQVQNKTSYYPLNLWSKNMYVGI